jgi:alkylation response protein AidB-like acyl-CoA dehydrogenase
MTVDAAEPDQVRAVHAAKAAAGEAAKRCAKDGIQIHGGIGYTWEHDLHLFMRRAFGTETLMGTIGWHHDRIGDLLFDGA